MAAPDSYVSPLKRRIRAALESAAVAEAAASESTDAIMSPSKRRVRAALARGEAAPSPVVEAKSEQPQPEAEDRTFKINRAPVVTLWVAVVAERQGFSWHTGLACGRAVASIFSNAKGKRLGIISEKPKNISGQQGSSQKAEGGAGDEEDGMTEVKVFGMQLKGVARQDGFQPLAEDGKPIQPDKVEKYLKRSFGAHFDAAKRSLERLASSWSPEELHDSAYRMYERFRPSVMDGAAGWGQHSTLDLDLVESLCGKQAGG